MSLLFWLSLALYFGLQFLINCVNIMEETDFIEIVVTSYIAPLIISIGFYVIVWSCIGLGPILLSS